MKKTLLFTAVAALVLGSCDKKEDSTPHIIDEPSEKQVVADSLKSGNAVMLEDSVQTVSDTSDTTDLQPVGIVKSKNFIFSYFDADSVTLEQGSNSKGALPVIIVRTGGTEYNPEINEPQYNQICEQYGDTCYYGYNDPTYEAVNDGIKDIDIVCNEIFDEEHGEGSSLSDIVSVLTYSPYNYIASNYKTAQLPAEGYELVPGVVKKCGITIQTSYGYETKLTKMQNISSEDIKLFFPVSYFIFDKLPSQSGTYTFVVTVKLSDKTLSGTVKMEF